MSRYRAAVPALVSVAIGLGVIHPAPGAGQDTPKPRRTANPVASVSVDGVDVSGDPLDAALARAGMRRSDLGWSPQGWWARYARHTLHKLDHYDALVREPLAAVPFTRTLAQAVREFLGPEWLAMPDPPRNRYIGGGHSLYRLLSYTAVDLRYAAEIGIPHPILLLDVRADTISGGRPGVTGPNAQSKGESDEPLDEAILELYRYADEPTRLVSYNAGYHPDREAEIRRRAARLPPEVSRILGRLVLRAVNAHRAAALAFRNVSMEQRLEISRRLDWGGGGGGQNVLAGLEYTHTHVLDDVAKAWDEASLWHAAVQCVAALDAARRALKALPPPKLKSPAFDWETPLGWIRVRGTEPDTIDATDALLVVDLGGADRWGGPVGASSPTRLLGLALDLAGDDVYQGRSATQGAGITGVGMLLDVAGNDRYEAEDYAQGVGQFGLGALIDLGGQDVYRARYSAQGSGPFTGIGFLADAAGDDRYEILAEGQGFAGPGGVGVLAERAGNDVYRAEPDAQKSGRPGFYRSKSSQSAAQGHGVGRQTFWSRTGGHSWAGGLGALLDIEGNDRYVAGDWSQASGYWFGTGVLYDGAGNDRYEAGVGSQAGGAHLGIGVLLDEGGDDVHFVAGGGAALAVDLTVALFVAIGGNDHYTIGGGGLGASSARAVGMFIDVGGNDVYRGKEGARPGFATYNLGFVANPDGTGTVTDTFTVTPYSAYLSSLGLFLDVGGKDSYWGGLSDGDIWGDEPGSDNWQVRSVGVGMDVPEGTIDWRPLPAGGGPLGPGRESPRRSTK